MPEYNEQPEDNIPHADTIDWKIHREGRAWEDDEFEQRIDLRPEKLEVWEGKLLLTTRSGCSCLPAPREHRG